MKNPPASADTTAISTSPPSSADATKLLARARRHIEWKEYVPARNICSDILAGHPDHATALYLLALCELYSGRHDEVVAALSRLVAGHPDHVNGLLLLSKACLLLGDHRQSVRYARQALDLDLRDHRALGMLADILGKSEDHDGARIACEKAIRLDPGNATHRCNYASILRIGGRIDEATRALESCIELDAAHCKAHWMLSSLRRQTPGDNHIRRLEQISETCRLKDEGTILIDFALSKEYEDVGEYEKSFTCLARACALKRRSIDYDVEQDLLPLRQLEEVFDARKVEDMAGSSCASHAPVFIVGLPRTGSTLIEQILGASGQMVAGGELPTLHNEIVRLLDGRRGRAPDFSTLTSREVDYDGLGRAYVEKSVAFIESGKHRSGLDESVPFIDKMPQNFAYVGFILLALPKAKVIVTERNAMDTCLGNLRQLYRDPFYQFSYRLDEMGKYFIAYDRLVRHWSKLFGDRIHTVQYEEFVARPEKVAERLFEYCGVAWQRDFLDAARRDGPVATASATQIREAINVDSVGRWRRFERQLAPLLAQLTEAGIET